MHDRVEALGGEQRVKPGAVAHVYPVERQRRADHLLQPLQCKRRTVDEVIGHHHLVATRSQLHAGVSADVAGSPAQQDSHTVCSVRIAKVPECQQQIHPGY